MAGLPEESRRELAEADRLDDEIESAYGARDYSAGVEKAERQLQIRRRVLGEEHPDVAEGLNNVAVLLWDRGDYAGAESLFREALAMFRKLLGEEHPHVAVTKRVDAAAGQSVDTLLAEHVKDYQSLFRRVSFNLGTTAPELLAQSTLKRLENYTKNRTVDPELEALFCQFGRYLLISCSRPGSLPANLQGVWNHSNRPAWACDYHSNINVEMNYWPAEPANLAECHVPFIYYVISLREVNAKNTQRHYGKIRGWTVQTMNNACGIASWKWNPPGGAWYAQHLWEHFAFGRDRFVISITILFDLSRNFSFVALRSTIRLP